MKKQINKKGFTLIEVVLVLAIGGLIFLLAFLAFQQATKNRRDSQRRSDASRVISEIENAKGDAGGTSFNDKGTLGTFVVNYLGGSTTADGGKFTSNNITYEIDYANTAPTDDMSSSTGFMSVGRGYKCSGATMVGTGAGGAATATGDYAVLAKLEKGIVCRDNQ